MATILNISELEGPESSSDGGDADSADEQLREELNTSDFIRGSGDSSDELESVRTSELDGADTPISILSSLSRIHVSTENSAAANSPSTSSNMHYFDVQPPSTEDELECYPLPHSDVESVGSTEETVEEGSKRMRLSEKGK